MATLIPDGSGAPLGAEVWGDTHIELRDARPLRDVFTGATLEPERRDDGYVLSVAAILERFPVALRSRPTYLTYLT